MALFSLGSLLRGSDWSQVTEYLSPVFFQIVPPFDVARQFSALTSAYLDKQRFASVCRQLQGDLKAAGLPQPEADAAKPEPSALSTADAQARGAMLLKLYFWQIFHAPTAILDLRQAAFGQDPVTTQSVWRPQPLYITYDPSFVEHLRSLYRGFYLDDAAQFEAALAALQLTQAKDLFRQHFGANQAAVTFSLAGFRTTFHGIFLACKQAKSRLHPNFLAFGAGLYCLYEHLEALGGNYDVRAAFFAATGSTPTGPGPRAVVL